MKKFLFVIPLLSACGLFQKKATPAAEQPAAIQFESRSIKALHTVIAYEYVISHGSDEAGFSIYPHSDTGFSFDYMYGADKGTFICTTDDRKSNRQYNYDLTGGVSGPGAGLSGWLSAVNFAELQQTGETRLNISGPGDLTFRISGQSDYNLLIDDSTLNIPVIELRAVEQPYFLSFVPDPQYPLITRMEIGYTHYLASAISKQGPWSSFQPAEGMTLQYRLIESGVNEFEIRLRNTVWNSDEIRFDMSGSYTSPGYSYDFHYDMVYKGKAIASPDFLLPVFSAIKGEKIEESTNWIFLRKDEITRIENEFTGYLNVPHYADDPREFPDLYEDSTDYEEAMRYFKESYRTRFDLHRLGRMNLTDYLYYDRDWKDEAALPGLRLTSDDGVELMVLNQGKYPLVLYYNDGQMYELMLESAGMSAEED